MTSHVDEVADELYGLHPSEFTALRDQRAKDAAAAGDKVLAKAIRGLRKPSTSAWLSNVLQRHRADELARLDELGEALRGAQATLAGDELRKLAERRRRFVDEMRTHARAVAAELGHPATEAALTELETTLQAALVDPAAAETVRAGRVTTVLQPDTSAMFGAGLPGAGAAAPTEAAPPADFQLAKARRDHDRAAEAVHHAEQTAANCRREISAAEHRLTDAATQYEQALAALHEAEADHATAEQRLAAAKAASTAADEKVESTRAVARAAKARLDELT